MELIKCDNGSEFATHQFPPHTPFPMGEVLLAWRAVRPFLQTCMQSCSYYQEGILLPGQNIWAVPWHDTILQAAVNGGMM